MGQLASKATWILSGDIGVRIIGFLTTVYLARTFGADGYRAFSFRGRTLVRRPWAQHSWNKGSIKKTKSHLFRKPGFFCKSDYGRSIIHYRFYSDLDNLL